VITVVATSYTHIIELKTFSDNVNKNVNLSTMALKVEEFKENDIYSVKDTYTGDLTGYIFNCPLCNGTLGCKRSYDITDGKTTYPDEMYGEVRIVASSSNLPCGSIVRFQTKRVSEEPVIAIVLDRGVRGNALDLLSPSYEYAVKLGRSVITYDVLRVGYGKK
jgi:3D (Asp-Asp-Asp) domain-containing protein